MFSCFLSICMQSYLIYLHNIKIRCCISGVKNKNNKNKNIVCKYFYESLLEMFLSFSSPQQIWNVNNKLNKFLQFYTKCSFWQKTCAYSILFKETQFKGFEAKGGLYITYRVKRPLKHTRRYYNTYVRTEHIAWGPVKRPESHVCLVASQCYYPTLTHEPTLTHRPSVCAYMYVGRL